MVRQDCSSNLRGFQVSAQRTASAAAAHRSWAGDAPPSAMMAPSLKMLAAHEPGYISCWYPVRRDKSIAPSQCHTQP